MNRHTKRDIATTRNWFFVILFLGLIVILTKSVFGAFHNIKVSKNNLEEAQVQYENLYKRGESIEDILENFENNFGFEQYVRENFGVVRPGEKIVIVINRENHDNEPREEDKGQD